MWYSKYSIGICSAEESPRPTLQFPFLHPNIFNTNILTSVRELNDISIYFWNLNIQFQLQNYFIYLLGDLNKKSQKDMRVSGDYF